ncbi:glucans biosynthesis glucosyltransferase MdoH [Cupriavidus taiwanensis]|uniref:glucans biosynthesis glucosyltransferase MdoH n=1 Tax=Cupriavidus taiwanensis TaxID=164546 RepID=UPI000E1166D6|nr:glucans biosynthesis glucosyltransferase MdoH [Cupriavidus taiwanensis]SOZ31751.1 glycosyltransferase, synthesis of membrane-derived oligosaccharide/synthesis of osmoregulated periplasmic glucans [Cupriavidus taiwanensis]SPA36493.1 glycosyltransferase, synthesis of membrane-derived oligosaccharide/synthesis of osmoregulated periplasmic glucans [Cupriavidus taiwanensis]
MELHLTPRLKQRPAQAAACERYLDRLPVSPEVRSELLADSASLAAAAAPVTPLASVTPVIPVTTDGRDAQEAITRLQSRLAGKEAPPAHGSSAYASVQRRFAMAYGNPQVGGAPLLSRREDGTVKADTGPAPQRSSMVPRQWPPHIVTGWVRNTWRRMLGRAPVPETWDTLHDGPDAEGKWHPAGSHRRWVLLGLVGIQTALATYFMTSVLPYHGTDPLEIAILVLFAILFSWVSAGFWTAMMGFLVLAKGGDKHLISRSAVPGRPDAPIAAEARTAIIMPICNEDVTRVFAGLRATYESLSRTPHLSNFDFIVLSDSGNPDLRTAEHDAWMELCRAVGGFGRIFYRWRRHRVKRKTGNVADFCRRWGSKYRYMVVLDADSVMSGDCLATLVRLMEANPGAGIIQTAPLAVGRETLYARVQQFATRVYGPLFTAGLHYWQLGESHYWGHNAIIRVKPFIEHCALAPLPGRGPLSGEILSHDFVEAALMRRAGWGVWIAYDLEGSYEELPPNLLDEVKRDRRWCQGNLMNFRLWLKQGFHVVHRAVFLTGIMAYLSAPLWLLFLLLSTAMLAKHALVPPEYFTQQYQLFPTWPEWHPEKALALFSATATLLFLPKLASVALLMKQARRYGGAVQLFASMLIEVLLSALLAPTRMLFHTKFVIAAYSGWGISWKSPPREDAETTWGEAFRRHGWHTALGLAWGGLVYWLNPSYVLWLLPIVGSLALSIPLSVMLSRVSLGRASRSAGLFMIPEETLVPREIVETQQHVENAAETPNFVDAVVDPVTNALMCATATPRVVQPESARQRHQSLVEHALTHGPRALTPAQKHVLLGNPFALARLHELVWGSPLADAGWKDTRMLVRRAANVVPLRPRAA